MPKKTEIRWTQAAYRDLKLAREYLVERNPVAVQKLMRKLSDVLDKLEKFPEMGVVAEQIKPAGRYRQIVLRPFLIVYRVEAGITWLLRFWDSRREPESMVIIDDE